MMGYPEAFWGFGNTMQIPDNFIGPHGIHFMYACAADSPKVADGILRVEGNRMIPVGYVRNLGRERATKDGPAERFGLELWSDLNHNGKIEPNELLTVRELCGESIDNPKHAFLRLKGTLWMDCQCNLYLANFLNRIYRIPAKAVDDQGAIVWDPTGATIVRGVSSPTSSLTAKTTAPACRGCAEMTEEISLWPLVPRGGNMPAPSGPKR